MSTELAEQHELDSQVLLCHLLFPNQSGERTRESHWTLQRRMKRFSSVFVIMSRKSLGVISRNGIGEVGRERLKPSGIEWKML